MVYRWFGKQQPLWISITKHTMKPRWWMQDDDHAFVLYMKKFEKCVAWNVLLFSSVSQWRGIDLLFTCLLLCTYLHQAMGISAMVMKTNHVFVFHKVCMDQEYGLVGLVVVALEVFLKIVDLVLSHLLIVYLSKLSKLLNPTIWYSIWKDFNSLGTYNLSKYNNILLFSQVFMSRRCVIGAIGVLSSCQLNFGFCFQTLKWMGLPHMLPLVASKIKWSIDPRSN